MAEKKFSLDDAIESPLKKKDANLKVLNPEENEFEITDNSELKKMHDKVVSYKKESELKNKEVKLEIETKKVIAEKDVQSHIISELSETKGLIFNLVNIFKNAAVELKNDEFVEMKQRILNIEKQNKVINDSLTTLVENQKLLFEEFEEKLNLLTELKQNTQPQNQQNDSFANPDFNNSMPPGSLNPNMMGSAPADFNSNPNPNLGGLPPMPDMSLNGANNIPNNVSGVHPNLDNTTPMNPVTPPMGAVGQFDISKNPSMFNDPNYNQLSTLPQNNLNQPDVPSLGLSHMPPPVGRPKESKNGSK